ncbi:DUF4398 domain-containing protein [Salinispirillum sp. LH 10-3-1]|uniref:DUF4398 domain-containing protein n=1 Tax=Salinispirillum sp. LH 10-3-1 TaxID=2952525 RepID=A0AB38YK63_9GAMM
MFPVVNRSTSGRYLTALFVVVAVLLVIACSYDPVARDSSMNSAREAIVTAERAGARHYAGSELDEAQEKLSEAEQAIRDEDMDKADRLARESSVVAELALVRTESAKALQINQEMRRSTDALLEEMNRTGE